MPRVVIILPTQTYRASDFVRAAASLDIDLIVASEEAPPIDMGDAHVTVDCRDPLAAADAIVALGDHAPIDAVVAADDAGVVIAAIASERLGLTGNPERAARATRNKIEMRRLLDAAEVDQPRFAVIDPGVTPADAVSGLEWPLVLKPIDRAASQGVIRVERPSDLDETVERIRTIVGDATAPVLAETYVPGEEIAIEGLIDEGSLEVLAVFDKPLTTSGPYFPETIFVTPSRLPERSLRGAVRVAEAAIAAIGLVRGPVHIELRVEGDRPRVLEVAARSIGGLCSRSLNFGLTGTSLESLVLRNALGVDVGHLRRESMASGVLMVPTNEPGVLSGFEGEDLVRSLPGVTGIDWTITRGDRVVPPPDGDRYVGFVYARAGSPEEVEMTLTKAMHNLQVQLEG